MDQQTPAGDGTPLPAPQAPQRWEQARTVVAIVFGLWLAWAALAVWTAPRHAHPADLQAALAAHRVVQHEMAAQPPSRLQLLVDVTGDRYYSTDDDVVVWTERGGRQHWIAPDEMGDLGVRLWYPPGVDESTVPLKRAERDGAAVWMEQHAGAPRRSTPQAEIVREVSWAGWFLSLLMLVRRPATGTRWFWFWTFGLPFWLGLAWFCWAEVLGHGRPRARRRSGWWGFLLTFLVNSALRTFAT